MSYCFIKVFRQTLTQGEVHYITLFQLFVCDIASSEFTDTELRVKCTTLHSSPLHMGYCFIRFYKHTQSQGEVHYITFFNSLEASTRPHDVGMKFKSKECLGSKCENRLGKTLNVNTQFLRSTTDHLGNMLILMT